MSHYNNFWTWGLLKQVFTLPTTAVAKYVLWWVCLLVGLWVCLSIREDISGTTGMIFTNFFCACCPCPWLGSASGMFMIGCIAYHREGVFFPVENALSARKGGWECTAWAKYAIYNCLVTFVSFLSSTQQNPITFLSFIKTTYFLNKCWPHEACRYYMAFTTNAHVKPPVKQLIFM